jgi:hypothetical protein
MLALASCDRPEPIVAYSAPKDPSPTTAPAPEMTAAAQRPDAAAPASAAPFTWTVPTGWKQLPANQMRVATFSVNDNPPVELTVIALGPEAGELLPNINRWENQLGLPRSPKESVDKVVKQQDINNLHVDLVDLSSPESTNPRQRMLAAIVPHADRIWFFKLTGPHEIVSAQKPSFDSFINSLAPAAPSIASAADQTPALPAPSAQAPVTLRTYKAPTSDWRELPDQKPPRVAAFQIGAAENKADFVITRFPTNGAGSFLDNINRWRNQLGLAPVDSVEAVEMKDTTIGADGPGVLVEFHNPDNNKRMLVALASAGGELYFFKLTGPADLVAAQRVNLESFLKSCDFK